MLRIRRATADDITRIRELERQSETAAHWGASQYHTLFSPDRPQRMALVASDDLAEPSIHGFLVARCLPEEWEIENVVVDNSWQRQRIGSALVRQILAEAGAADAASVLLEVRESNVVARFLYESIGFKLEGRRRDYYRDPGEDALLFRYSLQTYDKIP